MTKLYFFSPLSGGATKTFEFNEDTGEWELVNAYKAGTWLKPYIVEVADLKETYDLFLKVQDHACFMIHGKFLDDLNIQEPIVRRMKTNPLDGIGPTIENRDINLMCLDIDAWEIKEGQGGDEAIEDFLKELPEAFQKASYIRQFSSSYGLFPGKLKTHLFFWLKTPICNTVVFRWIKEFNKEYKAKLIDPSLLTALQPIYLQTRVCEKAEDPIKEFWNYVEKEGELDFNFPLPEKEGNLKTSPSSTWTGKYDLTESIQKILTSESFHDEINRLAMSLLNKKLPIKTVRELIEGAMLSAKKQLNDPKRLQDWQIRFDDIPRSIESACAIVGRVCIEDLLDWAKNSSREKVRLEFSKKALDLSPLDLKMFVDAIETRLGVGVRNIQTSIKIAREEEKAKKQVEKRKKKTALRKKQGIHEIVVTLSNTEEVCEQVCSILAESENGDRVFKAPAGLVKVGCDFPKTIRQVMKKHELGTDFPKMPIIQAYSLCSLGARMERDIVFLNSSGKDIPCPSNVLKIIAEGTHKTFKPLSGIVEHPFVNNDFQIVQKNGYDEQTGLYTTLHHKLKLTLMRPEEAYEYLGYEVFDEFPFMNELDRCVAIAALMTCIQRPVIAGDSGFPGFAIISPTQSSGKTTLAQLISYSVYNRAIPATSFTKDETELIKQLLSILREGHRCILFDNMPAGMEVTSNTLAKAMSSDTFSGRLLGDNKTIQVPTAVVWLFTGNSIQLRGDFATRVYPINLNANMEDPDKRNFKRKDIGTWAMDNRKKIISAIISLVLAAKQKRKIPEASRFPLWDEFVRKPLYTVAKIDINEAVHANKKNDSYLQAKINLLSVLHDKYGTTTEFSTRDVMEEAFSDWDKKPNELGDVLVELLDKKADNARSVGKMLGRIRGVVLGGLTLRDGKTKVFPAKWRVEKI